MRRAVLLAALALAGCGSSDRTEAPAAGASGKGIKLVKVGSFASPLYVTAPPEDRERIFVVEQGGRIRVVRDGKQRTFLDIRKLVVSGGEQGLLSVAFAPDYATSKRFYVYYTDKGAQQRVVEYTAASEDRADPASARLVLRMPDPESNHNGGLLLFGPDDLLYIGTGDGGGGGDRHGARGNGQNLGTLLGKILRIDPRRSGSQPYSIPEGNPFSGAGERREIYAYGLRNPWRFSFDRATGDLSIGDVGQNAYEEINFVRKGRGIGRNFGWRVFEGNHRYEPGESAPGAVRPVLETSHGKGNCSITGGVVVRDRAVRSEFGRYLFSDFCNPKILSARLKLPEAIGLRRTGLEVEGLSSFGEDARGRVYVVSSAGPVYRLAAR